MEKSWFTKLVEWMNGGINLNGRVHKLSPVKSENGKSWGKATCPKCGGNNGFVFRSHTDGAVVVVACFNCKKVTPSKPFKTCIGITRKGTKCKNKAKTNGYCSVHGG